jgi:tetraacyldisaccharide 4'-kinase
MPRAPAFWNRSGEALPARILSPLSALTAAATARRLRRSGWQAPVPVICCGNATVGGSGKTPLALDLGHRLRERGVAVHFLLRGYRGSARSSRRVVAADDVASVGDEALLLAEVAPTWIGGDRAASARAALEAGAQALIMDDGLQNPTLRKDLSFLVVDGAVGFGNGRVLPAGPLREPVAAAAARCRAAVVIGADRAGAAAALPPGLPVLRAHLEPSPEIAALAGRRVLAFAGIGRPEKFFATLEEADAELVGRIPFPDHHQYVPRQLGRLLDQARNLEATPVTTAKDAVRIDPVFRAHLVIAHVRLVWEEGSAIERLLDGSMPARARDLSGFSTG